MSTQAYSLLTTILLWGAVAATIAAVGLLVAVAVSWRSAKRNRRLAWCAGLTALAFAMVGSQQVLLYKVFLPSLVNQARQDIEVARQESSLTSVGDFAPTFSVVRDDGATFSLAEHRGKVVLINFFATWCGPCIAELPHIEAIWNDFRQHDDFAAIVIGREETNASLARFKSQYGLSVPMAADEGSSVFSHYATERIPRTYVISRDGTIAYQRVGYEGQGLAELNEVLAALCRSTHSTE